MVKLLHTADWHLGRVLHGRNLTEDQEWLLDRVVEVVEARRPDAVLVAGDVYDRAVPPLEAVRLLDRVLTRIVGELGVPVVLIAGNHDSPERLGFGAELLVERGLVLAGAPGAQVACLRLADEHGPVEIWALPFAEPAVVAGLPFGAEVKSHDEAMGALVEQVRTQANPEARQVLVGHAFVAGGQVSDSERVFVGGAGTVDSGRFAGFDYVALGHLHRRQSMAAGRVRYAGSLFKYSFSEAGHEKSVDLVTLGAPGTAPEIESIPLQPRRDLRCLEGRFDDLLVGADAESETQRQDYLSVTLTDEGLVYDAMARLRAKYRNTLHIARKPPAAGGVAEAPRVDQRSLSTEELFAQFFRYSQGRALGEEETTALVEILAELGQEERR